MSRFSLDRKNGWDYGRNLPPQLWHLIKDCDALGSSQSPIEIPTDVPANSALGPIDLSHYKPLNLTGFFFEDLHLEIEVDHKQGQDAGGIRYGQPPEYYRLEQFHFHTPSEHALGGVYYPMEIHLVHKTVDGERSIVVAILVSEGTKESPFLAAMIGRLPIAKPPKTAEKEKLTDRGEEPIARLAYPTNVSYNRYEGSLTTPPCTEGVIWLVSQNPIDATPAQVAEFSKYVPGGNNRPLQPRNGRIIERYEASSNRPSA